MDFLRIPDIIRARLHALMMLMQVWCRRACERTGVVAQGIGTLLLSRN